VDVTVEQARIEIPCSRLTLDLFAGVVKRLVRD